MGRKPFPVSESELRLLYEVEHLSQAQIARRLGCGQATVSRAMATYGITTRTLSEAGRLHWGLAIGADELRRLYVQERLSMHQIAAIYNCSKDTVRARLVEYDVPIRSIGQARTVNSLRRNYDASATAKAYLVGFSLGDLHPRMRGSQSTQTLYIECSSTRPEQIELIESLFEPYGTISIGGPDDDGEWWISCGVDTSFDFLLDRRDAVPEWIQADPHGFAAFIAGYTDAEGYIGVASGKAAFRLRSYDTNILHQTYELLSAQGIACPPPRIVARRGNQVNTPVGRTSSRQYYSRSDLWGLSVYRMDSLLKLFALIQPYLKHPKRLRDVQLAQANIAERRKGS